MTQPEKPCRIPTFRLLLRQLIIEEGKTHAQKHHRLHRRHLDHPDSKDPNVGTTSDETNVFKLFALLPGESQIRQAGVFVKSIQGQTAFYGDGVGPEPRKYVE